MHRDTWGEIFKVFFSLAIFISFPNMAVLLDSDCRYKGARKATWDRNLRACRRIFFCDMRAGHIPPAAYGGPVAPWRDRAACSDTSTSRSGPCVPSDGAAWLRNVDGNSCHLHKPILALFVQFIFSAQQLQSVCLSSEQLKMKSLLLYSIDVKAGIQVVQTLHLLLRFQAVGDHVLGEDLLH